MMNHKKTCMLVVTMILLLHWISITDHSKFCSLLSHMKKDLPTNSSKNIPFLIILCEGGSKAQTSQQVRRTRTLLKSAAALTRVTLRFTVFCESKSLFEDVVSPMKHWPLEYQNRLEIDYQPVNYPPGPEKEKFRSAFRPCATYRLLVPDLLQHVDAAVYIDTDIIFLNRPEEIWKEFDTLIDEEAAAIAMESFYTHKSVKFPFPGISGLNVAVLVMNLTRLRSVPGGGYSQITTNLFQQYKDVIRFATQDVINIFFAQRPHLLRELNCKWNYLSCLCGNGRNMCLEAEKHGAAIVHGNSNSFFKTNHDIFQDVFEAWEEYELGTPIQTLATEIMERLTKHKDKKNLCTMPTNMSSIITKQLYYLTN